MAIENVQLTIEPGDNQSAIAAGGYDLVVLANLDPPAAMRVARMVRQLLGATD